MTILWNLPIIFSPFYRTLSELNGETLKFLNSDVQSSKEKEDTQGVDEKEKTPIIEIMVDGNRQKNVFNDRGGVQISTKLFSPRVM